jgi:hypothetical protein
MSNKNKTSFDKLSDLLKKNILRRKKAQKNEDNQKTVFSKQE